MSGHDPGWNDPPKMSFENNNPLVNKRTSLNKRVGVALNQPYTSGVVGTDPTLPPPPLDPTRVPPPPLDPTRVPLSPPIDPSANTSTPTMSGVPDPRDQLAAVVANLTSVCEVQGEVRRRVGVLECMWTEGKIEQPVQNKILGLSIAIKRGDVDEADRLQKCLMVDHAGQCSAWMGGVRHIINSLREKQALNTTS